MGKLTRKNIRKKRNTTSRVNLKDKKKGGSAIMENEKNEIFPVIDDFKIYRRGEGDGNVPFDIPFEWSDNLLEDCFGIPKNKQNKLIETLPAQQQDKNQYIIHLLQPLKKRLPFYIDRFVKENNDADIVEFNQLSQYEKIEKFISKLYRYYEEDIECSNMVGDIGEAFIVFKDFALRMREGQNMEETMAVNTIIDIVRDIASGMKYKIFGVVGALNEQNLNSYLFTLPFSSNDGTKELYGEYYADNRLGVGEGYTLENSHKTNYHVKRYTMEIDERLQVGSNVFALGNENYFYPGTIAKVNDDTFMIKFANENLGEKNINKDDVLPEAPGFNVEWSDDSDNWTDEGEIKNINHQDGTYLVGSLDQPINKENVRIKKQVLIGSDEDQDSNYREKPKPVLRPDGPSMGRLQRVARNVTALYPNSEIYKKRLVGYINRLDKNLNISDLEAKDTIELIEIKEKLKEAAAKARRERGARQRQGPEVRKQWPGQEVRQQRQGKGRSNFSTIVRNVPRMGKGAQRQQERRRLQEGQRPIQPLLYSDSADPTSSKGSIDTVVSSADQTSSEGTIDTVVSSDDETTSIGDARSTVLSDDLTSSQGSLKSGESLSNEPTYKGSLSRTSSVRSIVPEEQRVEARLGKGNYYYSGTIVQKNGDGTYEIKYDNGDIEDNVEKEYINKLTQGKWDDGKEVKVKEEWEWSHERKPAEIISYNNDSKTYKIKYINDNKERDNVPAKLIVRVADEGLDEKVMKELRIFNAGLDTPATDNVSGILDAAQSAVTDILNKGVTTLNQQNSDATSSNTGKADGSGGFVVGDDHDNKRQEMEAAAAAKAAAAEAAAAEAAAAEAARQQQAAEAVEVKPTVNFKKGDQVKFLKGDKFVHGTIDESDIGGEQCKIKCVKNDSNCSNEGGEFYITANKSELEIDDTQESDDRGESPSDEDEEFKKGDIVEAIVVKDGSSYYYPGVIKEFFEDEKNDPYEIEFYNDAVNNRFYNKEDINKFPKNFKVNGAVQVFKDKENKWISRKVTDNNITGDNGKEKIWTTAKNNDRSVQRLINKLRVPVNKKKKKKKKNSSNSIVPVKKEDDIYTLKVGDTVSWWNRNADIDNTGSEIKDVKIIQVNEDGTYNISVNDNTDDERYKNVEKQYLKPEGVTRPEWNIHNNDGKYGYRKSDIKQFVKGSSVKVKIGNYYYFPGKLLRKYDDESWIVELDDHTKQIPQANRINKVKNEIGLFNIEDIENLDWGRGNIVWVDKSRLNHVEGNDEVRGEIDRFNQREGNIDSYTINELDDFLNNTGKKLINVTRHALRERVPDGQGGGARADVGRDVFTEPPDPIFNYYKFIINELAWPSGNKFGDNTFVTKNGTVDHGVRDDSFEKYYNGDAYLYKSLKYMVEVGGNIDNLLNQAFTPGGIADPYGFQSSDAGYYDWGNNIRPGGNDIRDSDRGSSVEDKNKHQNRCALLALDAYFIPAFKDNKLIRDDDNDEWKHDALQKYETGSYNGRDHAQISDPSKRNEWVGKLSNFRTQKGMIDKDISQYACVLRRLMIGANSEYDEIKNPSDRGGVDESKASEPVLLSFEEFSKLLTVIFDKMDSDIQIWFENNNGDDLKDPFSGISLHNVRKAVNGYDHKFDVSYLNKLEGNYIQGITFIKDNADHNEKRLRDIIMNLMKSSREEINDQDNDKMGEILMKFVLNITLNYYRKELKSILKHLTTKEKYNDVDTFKNYTSHDGIELKNIVNDNVIMDFFNFVQDTISYGNNDHTNIKGCLKQNQPKILNGMFTFIKTTLDMFINGGSPSLEDGGKGIVNRSIFGRSVTKIRKYLNYADDAVIKSLEPTRNPPNSILSIGDIIDKATNLYFNNTFESNKEKIDKKIWFDVFNNGFYFSDNGIYQGISGFNNVKPEYRMTKRLLHRYPKSGEDDNWTGKNLIESTLGDMKHLIKVDNTTCNRTRVGFHGKYGSTVEYLIKYIFLLPTLMDGKRFVFYKTNNWKALPISNNMANIEYYFTLSNLIKQKGVSSEKLNSISLAINSKISREKKQMELDKNAKIIKEIFGGKYNPTIGKSDFWYYSGDTLEDFDESNIKCNSNIRYQAEMLYQLQKLYYHLMTRNSHKESTVKNMKKLGFNYDKRVESNNPFENSKNVASIGKPMIVKDGKKILDKQYPSTSLFLPMRLEGVNLHEQYAGNLYRGQIGGPPLPNYLTISQEQENFSNRKDKTKFRNYIVPTTRNFDNKLRKSTQKHLEEIDKSSGKHMLRGTSEQQKKSLEPYIRKLQDFKGDKSCGCGFPEKVSNGKNSYQPPPDFMFGDLVYVRQHFNLSNKGLKRDNRGSDADGIDYIAKDKEKQQYNWYYNNGTDIKENTYQAAIVLSDRNKTNDPDGYDTFFISYLNEKTGWGCRGDSMPIGLNGIYTDHKFNKSKPRFINERISYFVKDYKENIDGKNLWINNTRCNINESDDEMKARYEKAVKMNDEFACLSNLGLKHAPRVRFSIYKNWHFYTKKLPKNSDFVRNCILARQSSALPYRMYAECATVEQVRDKAYERAKNWLKIMGINPDNMKKEKEKLENLMKGNTPIGVMNNDDDKASDSKVQKMHIAVKTHMVLGGDLNFRIENNQWDDNSKKGRSGELKSMNVINDKKDKGKIILRTGEKYELLKKIIAIRGGDTLDGLVNIRPNTKIQRPGKYFGEFSDKITDYRPYGVFIEWMDSYDGEKDGNEYWYGTNEKKTTVEFTEEEDNELGGSYDTNNWGKMPADIEAGLEWMEAFDDLRDLNSIVVGTIGYDVNDVLKAEKKERDNATMKIRAKMYNSNHASLIEGEAAANKKKMEKFLIDKKVTRKIILQVIIDDANRDWGNKGKKMEMTIEELWESHGNILHGDYKKQQADSYKSFKSNWTSDNSFKVKNRKYSGGTHGGALGFRNRARKIKKRNRQRQQQAVESKEKVVRESGAKSEAEKIKEGGKERKNFIKNIRDICDDHAAAVKHGTGTEWESKKLNQLTGPGNWDDVWNDSIKTLRYKIRWADVNTDYSSIAEETWYNPTAQRTCMIDGIKIARGIDDQKEGSSWFRKKKTIVREDDYPDQSKVTEQYGSNVRNAKGEVYDDNFFQNTKKSEFKQSFPAGLYEVPAHTLFWVGWSETHNTNYLPKESKETKDSFMGQPFIVREGKKENDNTGKNRDRINIRIPKTLLSTIGGFFYPHSLTLNTEGNNDNTDNLCVLHHNYDRKGVTNHLILNTIDIDTIELPSMLRERINIEMVNSKINSIKSINANGMESAQVYKNSQKSIFKLTKKTKEKILSIKDNNKKKPQHKRWVHHDGDYSNVKNIEYNLRETQKFIQNARYTIVKDDHKYAADYQFEKKKEEYVVQKRQNIRRSLGLLGLIDKHQNTAGKDPEGKQNEGQFTSYYNNYFVNEAGDDIEMYNDDNKEKLIPYKYVNDINVSMTIDEYEKKDDTWKNQPYTSLKYKKPEVVKNNDEDLQDAQVDIMVIDTTNKYNEIDDDAETYLNKNPANGALQLFSCEIDLGGIHQNGNRLDIGLQHRYFNPEYGGWWWWKKEKNAWKNNKAILDRTIKTRGGSNKKRFTRKK